MRINARLDDSYEYKFLQVQRLENKNRTDILKEALDEYFQKKLELDGEQAWKDNQKILQTLSGTMSAPVDSSTNYKRYVKEYLDEKFADR